MSTAQGQRRLTLAETRKLLYQLPMNQLFELPGRPHVVYQLRSYADTNADEAAEQARIDAPFLFKAFETGQVGPKRLARLHGDKPRMATIHEYLDWTVTAQAAEGDDELDFGGFRVLVILPRYRSGWPAPGKDASVVEGTRVCDKLGAPCHPLPFLQTHSKPVTAATIRSGPGYLEIPFVATHENKRGRGYCRCLVEAIEDIARALGLHKLMLCSTNDTSVKSTWQHLGFDLTSDEQMEEWDILHTDLVYLQNTTQMHKAVPPAKRFKPVVMRQGNLRQRVYSLIGYKRPASAISGPPGSTGLMRGTPSKSARSGGALMALANNSASGVHDAGGEGPGERQEVLSAKASTPLNLGGGATPPPPPLDAVQLMPPPPLPMMPLPAAAHAEPPAANHAATNGTADGCASAGGLQHVEEQQGHGIADNAEPSGSGAAPGAATANASPSAAPPFNHGAENGLQQPLALEPRPLALPPCNGGPIAAGPGPPEVPQNGQQQPQQQEEQQQQANGVQSPQHASCKQAAEELGNGVDQLDGGLAFASVPGVLQLQAPGCSNGASHVLDNALVRDAG